MTTEAMPKPVLEEIAGVTSVDIGAKFADELRVAGDEVLAARGGGDLLVYEKVWRDGQVKSTFDQLRAAVVSRDWYVEPGGDTPADAAAAEDLEAQLRAINWDDICKKMLFGVFLGYSVGECMLVAVDGRIELRGVKVRKSRRFRFDRDGALRLITRKDPLGRVMPPSKFWVFRAGGEDDDDPYGLGLGYFLYWPVWFKRNGFRFWSVFLEQYASPTPIARTPPGTTEPERVKLLQLLTAVKTGGRLVLPNNVTLELLKAIGNSGGDYETFARYIDADISKIVLSQTMTTDNGSSQSQATVHEGVKLDVAKGFADLLCESFNNGPAAWLTAWNHPGAAVPRVWRNCEVPADLESLAKRDQTICNLGFQPTPEYILKTYGEGFVPKTPAAAPAEDPAAPAVSFAEPAEGAVLVPSQDIVEGLTGEEQWRALIGPEVEAIEKLCGDCKTLQEVQARLGELAARNPAAITESLSRLMFAARVAGNEGADLDGQG
jgi:phage gp29-like protein